MNHSTDSIKRSGSMKDSFIKPLPIVFYGKREHYIMVRNMNVLFLAELFI